MKWARRIAIALAALLLMATAASWWLLGSGAGLRFALARAQAFTDGALSVQQARGRLLGPLELAGVRYADGRGLEVRIASARLDLRFWPLLRRRVHVLDLAAEGVAVRLPPPATEAPRAGGLSLAPPIDLVFDRAHVGRLDIRRAGTLLFASTGADLAGRWTADGIVLKQLALRAPDGHVDLRGQLAIGPAYRGDGNAVFAWKVNGVDYAGTLAAHGDGRQSRATLVLAQPMTAQLRLDLAQSRDAAWTASLAVPRFDPTPLLGASSLTALALDLRGSGDRHGGSVQGQLGLNDYTLSLQPLRARLSADFGTLQLEQLTVTSPQIKGRVEASGVIPLGTPSRPGALALRWHELQLPAALVGQPLASQGRLDIRGSTAQFHARGELDLGPPGQPTALALELDGTPRQLALHTLQLRQAQGDLHASGTLSLQPALAWQFDVRARRFDPGQLFAGWNGALDADLGTHGSLPPRGPDASLELRKLGGRLRERAVRGHGNLHLSPDRVLDGRLELASGASTLTLAARPGARNDVDLQLAIASLGDWWPNAGGRLDGRFHAGGAWPRLSLDGTLQGRALAWQRQTIDHLQLEAHVADLSQPGGRLDLGARGLDAAGLVFRQLDLHGDGTAAHHRLTVQARGGQLSGQLALDGRLKGNAWRGTLSTLDLEPQDLPRWRLLQPAALGYTEGALSLSELCLTAGDPLLCVSARQDKAGTLDAGYRVHALPLALLLNASGNADLPLRLDGQLEGTGKLRRNAAGAWNGSATLGSPQGAATYTDRADRPLLAWHDLLANVELSAQRQHATVHARLDDGGRLDGQMDMTGAQRALDGQLALQLTSLAPLELFVTELAQVRGRMDGQFRIGGTLGQPAVTGRATVADFAAEVPVAGLKLSGGTLVASTADARRFQLSGRVSSGQGTLAIDGQVGVGADTPTALTLKGQDFTAFDIPAARVVLSPDLLVKQDAAGIDIGGAVTLERADVNLDKLPGAGATKASPDVVVVDAQQQEQAAARRPVSARVKVDLGSKAHLVGMGLDGYVSGVLTVSERPGRVTTGQGQLAVSGTYRAYGQNLQLQRGQLLFASTPIDNPGLDLRAVRKLNPNATIDEGQQVGLLVSGTAKRPVLSVFSNPVMEQSDALAYLITGKPLSQVKGDEGDMVGAAAQALGSAAGDLLARSVGSRLGIDDIGVSSSAALGGGSAFTVGKYLSPRLYLSYGVGLFEPGQVITLRYRLSQRWNFEAQNATDFSRASFNYRIEK